MKSFNDLKDIEDKKIFLRLDLNVPIEGKKIKDDYKIKAVVKTINTLLKKKAAIIIATHLGKPKGKVVAELSTEPIAKYLAKELGVKIKFIPEVVGKKVEVASSKLKAKEILFIENLRFKKDELENSSVFAKKLASYADIYINDALAVSHRKQASVAAIKKYLPSYSGPLLEEELRAFDRILKPKKPLVTVMGGAKISTKAPLIAKLYSSSSQILLGGGLANNFLKHFKYEIGKSLYDEESVTVIKKILRGKKKTNKIILPIDVIVQEKSGKIKSKKIKNVLKGDTIYDIGPETILYYSQFIKKAQTLVWNGPMGKFEEKEYKAGTLSIARLIASRSSGRAYGLVGGGETVSALKQSGMIEYVDFVSTAGGAMLSYLGKEEMPGL